MLRKEAKQIVENTKFLLFDIKDIQYFLDHPPMSYVVEDMFVEGFVHILAGQAGIGKSIFALELARSVSSGVPFLSTYTIINPGPVLIIDSENPASLIRERIIKMKIDKVLPIYYLHFEDVKLNQSEWIGGIIQTLKYLHPRLVIFDSLARFHNLTENSAEGMAQISASLRELSNLKIETEEEDFYPAVLVIHHANKQPISGLISRGSGEIPAGCDIEYGLTKRGNFREFQSYKTRVEEVESILLEIKNDDQLLSIGIHSDQTVLREIQDLVAKNPKINHGDLVKLVRDNLSLGYHKAIAYIKKGVTVGWWKEKKDGKFLVYIPRNLPLSNSGKNEFEMTRNEVDNE